MSDILSIEIPELSLFDKEELKKKVIDYIKALAKTKKQSHKWDNYVISDATTALTLKNRPEIPDNYDEILEQELDEKQK